MWWGCKFFKKNLNKHWSAWSMFLLPNPDLFFFLRDAWWVQGLQNRPVRSNRFPPVAVYRTGLTRNRWKPVEFKSTCVTGSDRYTDRFDRFTGLVWPVTGVWTKKTDGLKVVSQFDRSPYAVGLNGPAHFFFFFFDLTSYARKLY